MRASTDHPVPVVGCILNNTGQFVLSWAHMRCRPVAEGSAFPAECHGGTARNVAVDDTAGAIAFVESLEHPSADERGRKMALAGDPVSNHVRRRRGLEPCTASHLSCADEFALTLCAHR